MMLSCAWNFRNRSGIRINASNRNIRSRRIKRGAIEAEKEEGEGNVEHVKEKKKM